MPIVTSERRRDRSRRLALRLALWGAAALLAAGCGGPPKVICPPFESLTGPAAADSLDLETFLALAPPERASRRVEAAAALEIARKAASTRARAEALMAAVRLAPDDPEPWLELADMWRWVGDYLHAEQCLAAAAASLRAWGSPGADGPLTRTGRDDAALRTAVLRAWLHYDRAEWREGMDWARAAAGLRAGDREVWRIQGLLAAALGRHSEAHEFAEGIRRKDPFSSDIVWILAVLDQARRQENSAFDLLFSYRARNEAASELRPDRRHAAECFRDMGMIAERVGEWGWARRWFAQSRAAVPLGRTDCIAEARAPRLGPSGRAVEMPVWLAFDRHYVTGSLSAYTNLALARFESAVNPAERDFWSAAAVNAAGIILRRDEDREWALRARGLVFAGRGVADRGLEDLRRAAAALEGRGESDAAIEAGIGHLLLVQEKAAQALGHLQRAVALDRRRAPAWSDLGLAQVMVGDRAAAGGSFARALELDPQLVTAWYNRGLMHLHAGDLAAAAADLAEAARLAPDNQEVARLLQQLEAQRRRQAR